MAHPIPTHFLNFKQRPTITSVYEQVFFIPKFIWSSWQKMGEKALLLWIL